MSNKFITVATLALSAAFCHLTAVAQAPAAKAVTPEQQAVIKMADSIYKEIVTLPTYGVFDAIDFTIKDGVVTLSGYASRPTLKSGAEAVTKKVEGVKQVVNNIKLLPLSPNDDQLRGRVFAAIYLNPALQIYNPNWGIPRWSSPAGFAGGITNNPPPGFYPVHIIVDNGHVTLIGFLNSVGDRTIAVMAANTVPGVFSVTDQIQIPPPDDVSKQHKKTDKDKWW
jgi:hyperosmotically inducible periplasmic protein